MKNRWLARVAGALMMAGALLPLAAPGAALAHERRQVGPYTFIVGWLTEPSLQGEPNGVDLRISKTDGGAPVEGAEKALKLQIAFGGGNPKEFPLRARFGQTGAYATDIIPTKAGSYIFTVTGTLEGTQVNQKFESGPGRFDDVQALDKVQFPEVVPAGAQMASDVKAVEERAQVAETRVAQAQAFGIAGTVIGLIGLAVGTLALLAARRAGMVTPPAVTPAPRASQG